MLTLNYAAEYEIAMYGENLSFAAEVMGVTPGSLDSMIQYETRPDPLWEVMDVHWLLALGENPRDYGHVVDTTREGSVERWFGC